MSLVDPTGPGYAAAVRRAQQRASATTWARLRQAVSIHAPRDTEAVDNEVVLRDAVTSDHRVVWTAARQPNNPAAVAAAVSLSLRHPLGDGISFAGRRAASEYPLNRFLRDDLTYLDRTDRRAALAHAWTQTLDDLHRDQPAFATAIALQVRMVVPIVNRRRGGPWNLTSPLLPRVLFLGRRTPGRLAESILHEVGHDRMNLLLQTTDLVEDPTATTRSPFVDRVRPVVALIHGAFSFAQEIILYRYRQEPKRHRYIELRRQDIACALDLCRQTSALTADGVQLLGEIELAIQ